MDRAKNRRTIQQCCLPVSLTPSAPLILAFSELTISGYPAYTCPYPTLQVRGFPPPSHGLGSGWFATPFLYDSFIHYFTPVYPDAIQAISLRHKNAMLSRPVAACETVETACNRFSHAGGH